MESGNGESSRSYWWRSTKECEGNGHMKIDPAKISLVDPKVRVVREMERLAGLAPDMDDLRHKLIMYRSGDFWMPTGGIPKKDCDIPPVNTILLVGFSGAGKSALINLMYCVLGRAGLLPFAQVAGPTSEFRTMFLEEHNVLRSIRNGFCVFDTRGLSSRHLEENLETLGEWMSEGVHNHQLAWRNLDNEYQKVIFHAGEMPSKFTRRKVGCVIVVVDIAQVHKSLKVGDSEILQSIKDLFCAPAIRKCNESPILIFTHGDLLTPTDRLETRVKLSQFLGISETNGVYDITCLTEHGVLPEDADPVTAYTLVEAVYRALMYADKNQPPKVALIDKVIYFLTSILIFVAVYFGAFAYWLANLGKKRMNVHKW